MELVRFRHKGLKQLHEDENAKGVPPGMADKLRKLLFALETAERLEQLGRFPGWRLTSTERKPAGTLEFDSHRELAIDFPVRRTDEHCQ